MALATATLNSLLASFYTNTSFANAAVWVKLHLGDPGSAGTSNPAVETTRKQATFDAPASAATSNNNALTWGSYPAAETVSWISLWTASSAGTFLGRAQLVASKTMGVGDTFQINIGDFDATAT